MNQTFDEKLARVVGTIRRIAMNDPHRRHRDGLLYWSNKAERLHDAAVALGGDPFGHHFEAFALLAGFSLEVLMKGTLTGLGEAVPFTHNLWILSQKAGLSVSDDDRAVLEALTVYSTWYSKYPAAKDARETMDGIETLSRQHPSRGNMRDIVDAARTSSAVVNIENYERLYEFFRQRFFDVQSSVHESAEFS